MKLGELFIELGTKGNTKELEKTLKQLKEAEKKTAAQIKLNKDLAKATTDEEKALIKKNYAQKQEIASTEKVINKSKERNKTILASVKGFTRLIGAISLAIGVMDRFANASAKTNQSILTLSQSSGVDINTINKYASAARSLNYNASREMVAQTLASLSSRLRKTDIGEDEGLIGGLSLLSSLGGKSFNPIGMNVSQFIENLREGIKGIDDVWVNEILSTMGISSELIPMLRMSAQEFNRTKNKFLSESEMREEQKRSLELQEKRDELGKTFEKVLIELYPLLNEIFKTMAQVAPVLAEAAPDIVNFIKELVPFVKELIPLFTVLMNILKPVIRKATDYLTGKDLPNDKYKNNTINSRRAAIGLAFLSAFGIKGKTGKTLAAAAMLSEVVGEQILNQRKDLGFMSFGQPNFAPSTSRMYTRQQTFNNTFNNTINTTQPADNIMLDEYQRTIKRGHASGMFVKLYE